MKRDASTYDSVRRKYDEFLEIQREKPVLQRVLPPQKPYSPEPASDSDMSKTIFAAIGVGIGVVLLALSGYSLYVALRWGSGDFTGAATGYGLVAFFLGVAGIGGIAATLNHNFGPASRRSATH